MNTLYLECKMGIAGDMFAAALLGLVEDKEVVLKELNDIGVPKVEYRLSDMTKCGIVGNHLSVFVDGTEEKEVPDYSVIDGLVSEMQNADVVEFTVK